MGAFLAVTGANMQGITRNPMASRSFLGANAGAALVVVLLAGGTVSVAGPTGFVGLVMQHVVRFFVGVDYRWILPSSAVLGGIFLVMARAIASWRW